MVQDGAGPDAGQPQRPMTRREARALREAQQPTRSTTRSAAEPLPDAAAEPLPDAAPEPLPDAGPKRPRGVTAKAMTAPQAAKARRRPGGFAVLLGCSVLLLAWALTALVDSALPGVHALASLSPLVSVLALPVLAVAAGRRSVLPAGVAVLAAVLPWTFAATYAGTGPGPAIAAGRAGLRVVFVDADAGAADPASVTAVARNQAADVVVITGLTDALSHRLTVAGLNRLVPPRWVWTVRDHHSGIGVYSRVGGATMHLVPGTPQPTAQGLLSTPAGPVDLVVAQLPGSTLRARPGWSRGLARLAGLPALAPRRLLVGDLDAGPWHAGFRRLSRAGWHDAADVVGRGLRPTWPSWSPLPVTPADHVLLGRGLGASSADTAQVGGTDHRAVVVQVLLPRAASPG